MKKILSALLVVAIMFSFSGCLDGVISRFFPQDDQRGEDQFDENQINGAITINPDYKFEYGTDDSDNSIHIIIPGIKDDAESDDENNDTSTERPSIPDDGSNNGSSSGSNSGSDSPSIGGNNGSSGGSNQGSTVVVPEYNYSDTACNHSFQQVSFVDSTCAKEGKKVSRCSKCQLLRTETVAKKTTHQGGSATCKSLAVCSICRQTYGSYASHDWKDATCQAPSTCRECGLTTGSKAAHYSSNTTDDCTVSILCDHCGTTMRAAKSSHSYSSGSCTNCGATDPNYVDTSKIKIKYTMTFFPVSIQYGSITSCTHEIDGKDLILNIKMKRNNAGSSQSLVGYYRITDPNFKTVAIDSYSTSSMSAGSSTTVTVRISGILTKTGTYEVYLTNYKPQW